MWSKPAVVSWTNACMILSSANGASRKVKCSSKVMLNGKCLNSERGKEASTCKSTATLAESVGSWMDRIIMRRACTELDAKYGSLYSLGAWTDKDMT